MKILQVHNKYVGKTGEETVVEEEKGILQEHGHQVIQYIKENSEIKGYSKVKNAMMLLGLTSSGKIRSELISIIKSEEPDVCHVHNTFPLITPVVYEVCKEMGLPVVQTLHNFKMICTNSLLFRNGEICEKCIGKSLYNSIQYKCFRESYFATAAQAHVIQHHRRKGTWNNSIDKYICLTDFQRSKLIEGGVPAEKLIIKPNFVSESSSPSDFEEFFLFAGKLDSWKGASDLMHLFQHNNSAKFIIIGKSENPDVFEHFSNVSLLGERPREEVLDYMRRCKAVLFPSKCYEGMPMVILEAFAHGKPVITRNIGAMSSMVDHGVNGLKYNSIDDFVKSVKLLESSEHLALELGKNALNEYKDKYTRIRGYENLLSVYNSVLND